jgi:hypothetical protein
LIPKTTQNDPKMPRFALKIPLKYGIFDKIIDEIQYYNVIKYEKIDFLGKNRGKNWLIFRGILSKILNHSRFYNSKLDRVNNLYYY